MSGERVDPSVVLWLRAGTEIEVDVGEDSFMLSPDLSAVVAAILARASHQHLHDEIDDASNYPSLDLGDDL